MDVLCKVTKVSANPQWKVRLQKEQAWLVCLKSPLATNTLYLMCARTIFACLCSINVTLTTKREVLCKLSDVSGGLQWGHAMLKIGFNLVIELHPFSNIVLYRVLVHHFLVFGFLQHGTWICVHSLLSVILIQI